MAPFLLIAMLIAAVLPFLLIHISLNDGHLINTEIRKRRAEGHKRDVWYTRPPVQRNKRII